MAPQISDNLTVWSSDWWGLKNKRKIKAPHNLSFVRRPTGDQHIPLTKARLWEAFPCHNVPVSMIPHTLLPITLTGGERQRDYFANSNDLAFPPARSSVLSLVRPSVRPSLTLLRFLHIYGESAGYWPQTWWLNSVWDSQADEFPPFCGLWLI